MQIIDLLHHRVEFVCLNRRGRGTAVGLEPNDDDAALGIGEGDQILGDAIRVGPVNESQARTFARRDQWGQAA